MREMPYVFMTDSDSDLPYQIADERQIPVIKMPYALDGKEYLDDNGRSGAAAQKAFFDRMRAGSVPSTSCLSMPDYVDYFEPWLKEGKDILYVAFSSNMSATLQYARQAWDDLSIRYPGRRLVISDTLSISSPMTLLIEKAHDLYLEGASMEEVDQWIRDNRMRARCFMTVDSLVYLKRGGRLSPTSAFFGTRLDIKPIIVIGREGKMDAAEKAKGRKKTLQTIVERTVENIEDPTGKTIILMHADVEEEALKLRDTLLEKLPGLKEIRVQMIGPVIGSHCGPGSLACTFMGKERPV